MDITNLLEYMYALERFGIKPGLEVMQRLLKALDNPEKKLNVIHIAGTNGKGSTAAMLESILRTAGYSTGLYTSPHLVRFSERIRLNGKEITNKEIAELVQKIKSVCEKNNIQATFFEFTTTLAFLYFSNKKPDYIITETGMGGRLDATNVVTPIITAITNIAIDHVDHLGNTEKEIAVEKAKIIKKNIPMITAETNEEIIKLFKEECKKNNSPYYNINDEFNIKISESDTKHQLFSTNGEAYEIKLVGEHQVMNACLAIRIAEMLEVKKEHIINGLKKAEWPGRLETVSKKPLVIIDGAHNTAGMKALRKFLDKYYPKVFLVLGISEGRHKREMLKEIVPIAEKIILTSGKYRGENPKKLRELIGKETIIISDVKEAVKKAMKMNRDLPILITGSIYMIGEAEELFL